MRIVNWTEDYDLGKTNSGKKIERQRYHVDVFEGRKKIISKCKVFPTPAEALTYTRSLMKETKQ